MSSSPTKLVCRRLFFSIERSHISTPASHSIAPDAPSKCAMRRALLVPCLVFLGILVAILVNLALMTIKIFNRTIQNFHCLDDEYNTMFRRVTYRLSRAIDTYWDWLLLSNLPEHRYFQNFYPLSDQLNVCQHLSLMTQQSSAALRQVFSAVCYTNP